MKSNFNPHGITSIIVHSMMVGSAVSSAGAHVRLPAVHCRNGTVGVSTVSRRSASGIVTHPIVIRAITIIRPAVRLSARRPPPRPRLHVVAVALAPRQRSAAERRSVLLSRPVAPGLPTHPDPGQRLFPRRSRSPWALCGQTVGPSRCEGAALDAEDDWDVA